MGNHWLGLSLLSLAACGSLDRSTATTDPDASPASAAGAAAAASGAAGTAGGGAANTCDAEVVYEEAVNLTLSFPGLNTSYGLPPQALIVDGDVIVERAQPEQLDLVDENGQRVSLLLRGSSSFSFGDVAIGTRFWLYARERFWKPNPFAQEASRAFSLRTQEDGPVLLATLEGSPEVGEALGLPISIQSLCTAEYPLDHGSDTDCARRVEVFEAIVDSTPAVHVSRGARTTIQMDGTAYELSLPRASYETYSDANPSSGNPCAPADWTPRLELDLNVVSGEWPELSVNQPVELTALPECRLGTDAPLVVIDGEELAWDQFAAGGAEFPIALVASDADSVEFSSDYGPLRVTGDSEALAVLERARWFSISEYYTKIFRETANGDALVAYSQTTLAKVKAFVSRSDVLGATIEFEPRCDWLTDVCPVDGGTEAMTLYDIVYGDENSERVPSHERATVSAGSRQFDSWVAVTPSCQGDPAVTAIFVARDQ
jgi:hypothetical protein